MAGGWYYAHEEQAKLGPYSGERLKELAASGAILPTDTVWKAGVDDGVPAQLVKNLFASAPAMVLPLAPVVPKLAAANPGTIPFEDEDAAPAEAAPAKTERPRPKLRATAVAVKGADLVGQDGVDARYRMKCSECGHKDSSCRTFKIVAKTVKSGFFCPKCKKRREVIVQGRIS